MKIKTVKCEQFAGIQDKSVQLTDGMNILVGENESGKSTIADLIFQMFFQDAKLSGSSDKRFIDKYFPKMASGIRVDMIDGTLEFVADDGNYKIRKEWEQGGGDTRLTLPEGVSIKDKETINNILAKNLKYGAGVYDEIIFPSQRRDQNIIQGILDQDKQGDGVKKDLAGILTKVVVETGGVSLDKIEDNLIKAITQYIDRWDEIQNLPEGGLRRGIDNRWSTKALIVNAYYDVEQIKKAKKEALSAEEEVKSIKEKLRKCKEEKDEASKAKDLFSKFQSVIERTSRINQEIKAKSDELEKLNEDLVMWPEKEKKYEQINVLLKEQARLERKEHLLVVKKYNDELSKKERILRGTKKIDRDVLERAQECLDKIERQKRKIDGMNLLAKFRQADTSKVTLVSAISGKAIRIEEETKLTEPVRIVVKDVLDVVIEPVNMDVEEIVRIILAEQEKYDSLLEKYSVKTQEELEDIYQKYTDAESDVNLATIMLDGELGDEELSEVLAELRAYPENDSSLEDVERELERIMEGAQRPEIYLGILENDIRKLKETYGSVDKLKGRIEEYSQEIVRKKADIMSNNELPEEFQKIENPVEYEKSLRDKISALDGQMETIRDTELEEARNKLREKSSDEYDAELKEAERIFGERKTECARLVRIRDKFYELKNNLKANPMSRLAERFNEYLAVLSHDGLSAFDVDDKLNASIKSGNHILTYGILSEGTKDTIALAFRLAMLENLFPDGDGFAIFDDPFTDMSPDRVSVACELVQKFAEHNQVIFITCDPKYQSMFRNSNVIEIKL